MNKPERSVEEIVEKSWNKMYDKCSEFQDNAGEIGLSDISDIHKDLLTQTLQAERQRCDEMVEAEREKIKSLHQKWEGKADSLLLNEIEKLYEN